jgi:hypothetical protein
MPNFELFEDGTEVTNLVILEPIKIADAMYATHYLVRYGCCGKHGTLSHRRIRERLADGSTLCKECNRKSLHRKQVPRSMKPGFHGWAPPPSAVRKR